MIHPDSANYQFISWFYKDGDTEKAFDFSMPITKDMNIYAKWSSTVMVDYTIKYAVENEDGSLTYIAEDTVGKALANTNKTFEAKTGEDLYIIETEDGITNYQEGYFPETNSHSMTLKIDENNTFTFIYVPVDELPYVVNYLEAGTEKVLRPRKKEVTKKAIETETFVPVAGYMPDAYQKRLVLSANEEENVITFWYTKDEEHAPVQGIHYLQNAEGNGYTVYFETADLNSEKNKPYSVSVLTNITGAAFTRATASYTDENGDKYEVTATTSDGKVTSTVTKYGLLLELYYDRGVYPYEFRFLEQGTNNVLATAEGGTDRYGKQVTQNAKTIDGYDCVSGNAQAMTIQIEESSDAVKNVKVFYYTEQEVTIKYEVVGPTGCGSVRPASETVKVLSEDAQGATASAASTAYKFVGWYDKDGNELSTQAKYIPAKVGGKNVEATYYAKFAYNLTSLTIDKNAAEGTSIDDNQTFLFEVTDSKGTKVADVVITGDGQTTISGLTVGETYTVTEDTDWSWRYTPTGGATQTTAPLSATAANIVTFENTKSNSNWLSGVCYAVNNWFNNEPVRGGD